MKRLKNDDDGEPDCPAFSDYFYKYPYAQNNNGRIITVENPSMETIPAEVDKNGEIVKDEFYQCPEPILPANTKEIGGFAKLDYTYHIAGVHQSKLQAQFDFWFLRLKANLSLLLEPTEQDLDRLSLGNFSLLGRFRSSKRFEMAVGIGANVLLDPIKDGTAGGFRFALDVDTFPKKPVVISINTAIGSLRKVALLELHGSMGFIKGPIEIQLGYRALRFTGNFVRETLHGPFGGIRFWY